MTAQVRNPTESHARTRSRDGEADAELVVLAVARAKEGDRSALHYLYVRYAEDVQRYVHSIVRDHHDAEDITQSIFVKLMSAIHSYQPRSVAFAAWLMRVARNAALDSLRAKRTIPSDDMRVADPGKEEVAFDRRQSLKEALTRVPHEQREVLVLRYLAGLPPRDIARRLGKTESSVHGLQHRGRRALKEALKELDATPSIA